MQPDNYDITALQTHWNAEQPRGDLAGRITAHARTLPQQQPWGKSFASVLNGLFGGYNRMAFQGAALAAMLVLGMLNTSSATASDDADILTSTNWTESL
ncbi:MAG: hypothetical protein V4735_08085 [Pseudomonadota bacterium]